MSANIALLSGEMSGDVAGGELAAALLLRRPDLSLWGLGCNRMREAGVEVLHDSASWGGIGIVDSLRAYPTVRHTVLPSVLAALDRRKPALVVFIDFGAFNVRVARWCKPRGFRTLYYFPPGSWRMRARRSDLPRLVDKIATPFPWSAEILAEQGANVEFVGHPLLDTVRPSMSRNEFAARFGLDTSETIVGLLPGSRGFEVRYNTPAMLGAASCISRDLPGAQFVFAPAHHAARLEIERQIRQYRERRSFAAGSEAGSQSHGDFGRQDPVMATPDGVDMTLQQYRAWLARRRRSAYGDRKCPDPALVLADGMTYDVMAHSDALIVCSGTATLEAAILGTPMTVLYRGSRVMEIEQLVRRVRPEHIAMPNIIARKRIVPELIQHEASPDALAECTLRVLRDPAARAEMKAELAGVRAALGEPGAAGRVADMAIEMIC